MFMYARLWCVILTMFTLGGAAIAEVWPGYEPSEQFNEQVCRMEIEPGVRAIIIAPAVELIDPAKPAHVVVFATPNGNTVEQTLGCRMTEGLDWHYDIQHIAAQHRAYREINQDETVVLVCVQTDIKSWPTWRKRHEDDTALIEKVLDRTIDTIKIKRIGRVTLASHSGGGAFMFGVVDGAGEALDSVDRMIFLDSNYYYDDAKGHGETLAKWLADDEDRRLIVIAYDDREVTYKGKKIVSETGGTYRATHRMIDRFKQHGEVSKGTVGAFDAYHALGGQAHLLIHPNRENIIQHTRMVGEMNGHLYAMLLDTADQDELPEIGGPRAYMQWVQAEPYDAQGAVGERGEGLTIPPRPEDAPGGRVFMKRIEALPADERDMAIRKELLRGNVPGFMRRFVTIHTRTKIGDDSELSATYDVSPDYLCVGSDEDYVRVPVTPMTAQAVADRFGCALPTRKMVDDIYDQAAVKLAPLPLTEQRQSVTSLLQHNGLIEWQREGHVLGKLVAGIKKDVVVTNRLKEKPGRVAIYGWHRLNGEPIQPLSTVHTESYTDYSHGVRLIKQAVGLGDQTATVEQVLSDPSLAQLLSDEGVIESAGY